MPESIIASTNHMLFYHYQPRFSTMYNYRKHNL